MLNQLKDALLGVAKLVAIVFYWIGWCLYAPSKYVLELKYSSEVIKKVEEIPVVKTPEPVVKKRAPRKKKVTENVANTTVNS